ncbi:hypothetical protein [Corynebacterium uterequi]|uniref:Uncharacterized protein n=1 Tax=Corynebacterium uterequi TaxID=1072256 RepID=A0A0G3HIZ8_9CORY|nr:hypothetical protein [Corynebacterium uterequi]AKK11923.1 hypothetical protein CUTER_09775 [Corynebacterium uterequi]
MSFLALVTVTCEAYALFAIGRQLDWATAIGLIVLSFFGALFRLRRLPILSLSSTAPNK